MNKLEIRESAQRTLRLEAEAIQGVIESVDDQFVAAVEMVFSSQGRLVVTGIGKSANIANKIVATLNSTGTPAVFMHAADAIHGDLGNIQRNDVVMALSKSGNTPEVKALVPLIKNMGNKLIALSGNAQGYLAQHADYFLNASVTKEACPNNLAPTTSTTTQLAIGDAFAVCLLEMRGFSSQDFARYHPGGALGKRLFLRVRDLLHKEDKPSVAPNTPMQEVILEISSKRLGVTAVENEGQLVGVITDGDLRRMLEKGGDLQQLKAEAVMGHNPKTVQADALAVSALQLMEQHNITQALVVEDHQYIGVVHLHDLLREGIH
ncbi:MAG: SIS domain-containing protein [Salibacteraceae bacterium]